LKLDYPDIDIIAYVAYLSHNCYNNLFFAGISLNDKSYLSTPQGKHFFIYLWII